MIDKISTAKRQIIQKIVNDEKIKEIINNNDIEYSEDLIGQNVFPYLKIDDTVQEAKICLGVGIDFLQRIKTNIACKEVQITFLIVCQNRYLTMDSGYSRTDILSERLTEIFNWNDYFGFDFDLVSDIEKPFNNQVYTRELVFRTVGNNSMVNGNRINK